MYNRFPLDWTTLGRLRAQWSATIDNAKYNLSYYGSMHFKKVTFPNEFKNVKCKIALGTEICHFEPLRKILIIHFTFNDYPHIVDKLNDRAAKCLFLKSFVSFSWVKLKRLTLRATALPKRWQCDGLMRTGSCTYF